jgi:hypothetical protein
MIEERAKELLVLIKRQRELTKHLHLLDGFRTQASAVADGKKRVDELIQIATLLSDRGIATKSFPAGTSALRNEIEQLRERFVQDPTYILGANRLSAIKSSLPVFADRFQQALLASWKVYAMNRKPPVNFEVLNVLERIEPLRRQVERVAQGLRSLSIRSESLPRTVDELDDFENIAAKVNVAWKQLDSDHLPPDVLRFLKESGSPAGADLDLLIEPVKQWLRDHKLDRAFRIRSAAPIY